METAIVILLVVLGVVLLAILGVAIFLFVKLIKLGKLVRSDLMPWKGPVAFWGAIIYAIFPLDLVPDPVYFDDIGIMVAAIVYIQKLARENGIIGGRGRAAAAPPRLSSTR